MKNRLPSTCPLVFSLDIFGDKWTLIILRDILFNNMSHFREFLATEEKIASNILSNRLELLTEKSLITKHDDPKNKSAAIYMPTKKALDLIPMLIELMRWGVVYNPTNDENDPLIRELQTDAAGLQKRTLEKFRTHLGN
jgi:DNA-binding HxlR family transcriptional regulator